MDLNLLRNSGFDVRLGIEGVHLAHAASQKQMDHGDVVALFRRAAGALSSTSPKVIQRNAAMEPILINERRSKVCHVSVSLMMKQKFLGIEDGPQQIFKALSAAFRVTIAVGQRSQRAATSSSSKVCASAPPDRCSRRSPDL